MKLSAPAVSMQIKELETEVGLPLFDRTSRQVSLTMVGEYVLAHTRRGHSPYTKGNFQFDRVVTGWRSSPVVDYRHKK